MGHVSHACVSIGVQNACEQPLCAVQRRSVISFNPSPPRIHGSRFTSAGLFWRAKCVQEAIARDEGHQFPTWAYPRLRILCAPLLVRSLAEGLSSGPLPLCICVYVCIYTYMCICICVYAWIRIQCICIYMNMFGLLEGCLQVRAHKYIFVFVCVQTYMYVSICLYIWICLQDKCTCMCIFGYIIHMYAYVYIYVCVCMCTYI